MSLISGLLNTDVFLKKKECGQSSADQNDGSSRDQADSETWAFTFVEFTVAQLFFFSLLVHKEWL